jgi:hypothetical protein
VNVDPETVATTESFMDNEAVNPESVRINPEDPETENR